MKRFYCNLLILLYILAICSCNKNGKVGNVAFGTPLHYVDSAGNELFSTSSDGQNGYWMDSVIAYDYKGGNKKRLSTTTNGVNFVNLDVLRTEIMQNDDLVNQYTKTLIHVKSGMDDTLVLHLDETSFSSSASYDSIFYNGKLLQWDVGTGTIKIVK